MIGLNINRWQAFGIHFLISFIVFLGLLALILWVWYPSFLFDTDGGWQGLKIVVAIDLVLGPLLTLVVFKPGKPKLKLDLTLIGLAQTICLAIGVYIVYSERPLSVTFVDDTFYAVSQGTFDFAGQPSSALDKLPGKTPKQVYIELPPDKAVRKKMRREQINHGPLHARTKLFRPYHENALKAVEEGGILIDDFLKKYPDSEALIENWLLRNHKAKNDIVLTQYVGRDKTTYLILDSHSGQILDKAPGNLTW